MEMFYLRNSDKLNTLFVLIKLSLNKKSQQILHLKQMT